MTLECNKNDFHHEVRSAKILAEEFSKHPCCSENCASIIAGLPSSPFQFCFNCYPTGFYHPSQASSSALSASDEQKDLEFAVLVKANRALLDKFRPNPRDTPTVAREKDKHYNSALYEHFKAHGTKALNGSRWNWDKAYYIIIPETLERKLVCKTLWFAIWGVTKGTVEYIQGKVRNGDSLTARAYETKREQIDEKKAFEHWGIDIDTYHNYIKSFCLLSKVPESEAAIILVVYLADFFDLVGEAQPDVMAIHYDPISYNEMWQDYQNDPFVKDISSDGELLGYSRFCAIVRDVFPRVSPRQYKSVTGKCNVCEKLRSKMKECTLRSDKLVLKRFRLFHRNKYMGEKVMYYNRIMEAVNSNGRVWSFIFDAMSKFRTRLPIQANMAKMSQQFDNDVMGCIFHNKKRTQLYVSGPSVQLGVSYMIHCLHAEIKRCIDTNETLPDKIYLQIDGASDNTGHSVFAALEHLIGAGLCPVIEVWRLPVGHTHEDIDGRFGVLSMYIREQSIETPQKFFAEAKAAFLGECEITYVEAIYDYKLFYDELIDAAVKIKKQDYTMLGFRFELMTEIEKEANPGMLDVKINYRKGSQDAHVELREMNPTYNGASESSSEIFYPIIICSKWMPESAMYEGDRAIGIGFLEKRPVGTPKPMALAPWTGMYRNFLKELHTKYPRTSEAHIFESWQTFIEAKMPTKPNTYPAVPTDNILDYVVKMGSDFNPPLGEYLYGREPQGFHHLRTPRRSMQTSTIAVGEVQTAFTDHYAGKATWVDDFVKCLVRQDVQTVPHKGQPVPFRKWDHTRPEILQGVNVKTKVYNKLTKKYDEVFQDGIIVAYTADDVNHPPIYRVVIQNEADPTASKVFVDIQVERDYYEARFRYRSAHPDEETLLDDKHDANRSALEERAKKIADDASIRARKQAAREKKEQEKLEKIRQREDVRIAKQALQQEAARKKQLLQQEIANRKAAAALNPKPKRIRQKAIIVAEDRVGAIIGDIDGVVGEGDIQEPVRSVNSDNDDDGLGKGLGEGIAPSDNDDADSSGEEDDRDVSDHLVPVKDKPVDKGVPVELFAPAPDQGASRHVPVEHAPGELLVPAPQFTRSNRVRIQKAPGVCQCGCGSQTNQLHLCRGGALNVDAKTYTGCQLLIDRVGGCSLSWYCHFCVTKNRNRGIEDDMY